MERLPTIVVAAIGLGIVEQSVVWGWGQRQYVEPVLFVIVLVALLVTPAGRGLRSRIEPSTWHAVREPRPVPRELARLPEVRAANVGLVRVVALVLLALPVVLSQSRINLVAVAVVYAVIALSLVVLTGWAWRDQPRADGVRRDRRRGRRLDHRALGLGPRRSACSAQASWARRCHADRAAGTATTRAHHRGDHPVVLAHDDGVAAQPAVLRRGRALRLAAARAIERPDLFGFIDVKSETRFYLLCLVALALAIIAVRGIRRSGRDAC